MWTRGLSKFLQRDDWWLQIMGRLKPGVDEKSALAQLGVVFRQSSAEPDYTGEKSRNSDPSKLVSSQAASLALESIPANRGLGELRERFSKPLFILMAAVALVLLIACANVTNLLSARATSRHKEIAVRLAIGAGRKRLIRQLLTESVLLATFGGIFGLLLAYLATHLLVNLMSRGQKLIALNIQLDLHVLGFTAVISLVTGVLFGLVPALRGTHLDLTPALKEDSKGLASNKRSALLGLTKVLVVSQVALSLLLLAGAGLFIRTLVNLEIISLGFDSQNILLFGIDPTQKGYKGEKLSEFYEELEHRIESLPGVRSASFSMLGQIGAGGWNENISIEGYVARRGESGKGSVDAHLNGVGPRFLNTMGIPLLLCRSIEETDKGSAPKVAVVNETARDYLDTSSPIGRRFGFGKKSRDFEVIGIAADTKYDDLRRETPPLAYLAAPQVPELDLVPVTFEVRSTDNPVSLIPKVRAVVQSLDKNLPLSNIKTQSEQIDETFFQERLFAKLSSFFGLLALILACIGIYGIMSYAVARRTNEIGICMALGARQEVILRNVLREALALVLVGIAIGIPISFGVLRFIASMLFGLKPTDPLTLAITIAFMLAVAAIAGYLSARRASRVDPMGALRYE